MLLSWAAGFGPEKVLTRPGSCAPRALPLLWDPWE